MLPILRIITVGGVSLAIAILVLSLGTPGGSRSGMTAAKFSARGPLQQIDDHPEWRQLCDASYGKSKRSSVQHTDALQLSPAVRQSPANARRLFKSYLARNKCVDAHGVWELLAR